MNAPAPRETYETVVRLAREAEAPLVLDSWLKSYAGIGPPHERHYAYAPWEWRKRVALWCVATAPVYAVCLQVNDVALGWCCGKPGLLHYVYVLHEARRQGLAGELLSAALGYHPNSPLSKGTRMTHRPNRKYRGLCNALGWRWEPVTLAEIEA